MTVVKFYPSNAASNPDNVLEQAIGEYEDILIIGWNKNETLDVRASLRLNGKDILWLLEKVKYKMIRGDYGPEEE